ncbi:SON protein [Actinoplanes sp. SE50]|uniref:deaminase n=1 Tax=unclassified Actinoplanes TaxID=2626549 RepID=UPI00023EBC15|nr:MULTISPECIES: deaminase [unclassified Actinoplanes]AEV86836.1 SON protein [Actinoplanes sp. SE50/110]ATO85233.1 SON protein [Actinoplanes sp. SE50]SLM02643.1 uncharacterized protein ACSP50_5925 [Actinoplanes sp. SE50/110]
MTAEQPYQPINALPPPPTFGVVPPDPLHPASPPRHSHRRWWIIGIAAAAVLLIAVGATIWFLRDRPKADRGPFDRAVANLAAAPMLRYTTTIAGVTADLTVTGNGDSFGAISIAGQHVDLLTINKRNYVKFTTGLLGTKFQNRWVTGPASTAAPLSGTWPAPADLADTLFTALDQAGPFPKDGGPTSNINGVAARKVATPNVTIYITDTAPFRVLRLDPASSGKTLPTMPSLPAVPTLPSLPALPDLPSLPGLPALPTGVLRQQLLHHQQPERAPPPAAGKPIPGQMDLFSLDSAATDKAFGTLAGNTAQLTDAVDTSVQFSAQGTGTISCGVSGCRITTQVSNKLATTSPGKIADSSVSAVLNADIRIDGQPAGSCEAGPIPMKPNGATSISCTSPEAGATFAAIKAEKEAAAKAAGGGTVTVSSTASAQVYATAQTEVEVTKKTKELAAEQQQAQAYQCPVTGKACTGDPFNDLAAFRKRQGMPEAGTDADKDTAARLDVGGQIFYGRNGKGKVTDIPVNAYTRDHAEGDVFQQAKNAKITADRAVMYVDRPLCDGCGAYGGVGSLLRGTGIKEVVVVAPNGRFLITAARPSTPQPLD